MKITIEKSLEDDDIEEFSEVTTAYLAVKYLKPATREGKVYMIPEIRSFSWGSEIRDILKELRQSIPEIQKILEENIK